MDTTEGRNTIADELLKSLKEKFYLFRWVNKNKPDCEDDDESEVGPWKDEDGNCGY